MITYKEIISLILAIVVLSFSIKSLIFFTVILIFYITGKKLTAYYYEADHEEKIWTFQRYGFYEKSYFKKPIPIGIILPFLLSLLTFGYVKWFAVTESEIKPTEARAVKRHDYYSFSEMTEFHLAMISASGIFSCFILSFLAYLLNFPDLARLSIYFASFNLLPLGKLDGTRIFFGSRILYAILVVIAIIALGYAFLLI